MRSKLCGKFCSHCIKGTRTNLEVILPSKRLRDRRSSGFTTTDNGFRHGRHTALATLHKTTHATSPATPNRIILPDVTKAFDKVWHTGLKFEISQLNIHTLFTKILSDFNSNRTVAIRIAHHTEPPVPIELGVPQGAVISQILYNFYTHDLPPPIPNTDYIAFVDDITELTLSHHFHNMAARLTTRTINQINDYERKWKIQTNTDKFKLIVISRRKKQEVFIHDSPLPYDNAGKILGLYLSSHGYAQHIKQKKAIALNNL
ncbi:Reverse transcriptase domain [Trinorchestia longiramus]|nr:Reverse transcriptase domain [Trinorchestia longiramus]